MGGERKIAFQRRALLKVHPLCPSVIMPFVFLILVTFISSSQAIVNRPEYMDIDYYEDPQADSSLMSGESSIPPRMFPQKEINFISPSQELAQSRWWYEGPLSFSAKGMDHLYLLNSLLMDWIQPPGLPDEIVKEELLNDPLPMLNENRNRLLSHFWGMILACTIGVSLAVVVPLLGFMLCCCICDTSSAKKNSRNTRAKGRHDSPTSTSLTGLGRSAAATKKRKKYRVESGCDSCCRSFFGVIHFVLILLITFFVICAFVTNEYVRNGLHDMPKTINQSLDDVHLYLNNTQFEVNTLLRTNYGQLEQELFDSLDRSGIIVKNRLALVSQAIALDNLTEIVLKLETIQSDLRILSQETNELRNSLHLLTTGLHRAKKDLEKVFKECPHPVCTSLRSKYRFVLEKFRVSANLDELPDLSPLMSNISALLQADIVQEVRKGKEAFDRIGGKIQSAVNDSIPEIKRQIHAVGEQLEKTAKEINSVLRIPNADIKRMKDTVGEGGCYIERYEKYRWYACLAGSGIVLAILVCYTFGMLKGVCGTQPTINEYRNRRKKPPSTWLLSLGVFLVFFFFAFLMLATVGLFTLGGVSDRVGCHYLEHPDDPSTQKVVTLLEKHFHSHLYSTSESLKILQSKRPNIADILTRCHQNMSLYHALQLSQFMRIHISSDRVIEGFNITSILQLKDRYKIEEKLNTFLSRVEVNPAPIVILTKEGKDLLDRLKDTSLGTLNFSSFADLVNQRVTPLELVSVANELENEANLLPPSQIEHSTNLKNIAIMLESYQHKVIAKVHHSVERLRSGAGKIEVKAQYGSRGLKEALTDLLEQAKRAQVFIEEKGTSEIRRVAKGFILDMSALIDQYSEHVVREVEHTVGRCEPVSRALNASIMSVCKEVVLPFNGYWLSMASALVLCLPATLSAYILSKLYPKLKKNPIRRQPVAEEYSLDNLDDDDVPLANLGGKHETSHPYAVEARRAGPSGYYSGHSSGHHRGSTSAGASAPVVDDSWSPSAHIYPRPPPYNFNA